MDNQDMSGAFRDVAVVIAALEEIVGDLDLHGALLYTIEPRTITAEVLQHATECITSGTHTTCVSKDSCPILRLWGGLSEAFQNELKAALRLSIELTNEDAATDLRGTLHDRLN